MTASDAPNSDRRNTKDNGGVIESSLEEYLEESVVTKNMKSLRSDTHGTHGVPMVRDTHGEGCYLEY